MFDPTRDDQRSYDTSYGGQRPPAPPPPAQQPVPLLDARLLLRLVIAVIVATVTAHALHACVP